MFEFMFGLRAEYGCRTNAHLPMSTGRIALLHIIAWQGALFCMMIGSLLV